jgi:hypothetical protein
VSENCELCILDRINHVFYNCDDFIIIPCDNCNVPMAVPYEHIDPANKMLTAEERDRHKDLKKKMGIELHKVACDFFDDFAFYIDKKENKIPDHMHWHARGLKNVCGYDFNKITRKNKIKKIKIGIL